MRTRAVLLAAALLSGCTGEVLGVLEQDAGPEVGDAASPAAPDAASGEPDASHAGAADAAASLPPDASEPDAETAGPDAAAPGLDAAQPGPDAASQGPDASVPAGPSSTRLTSHPLGTTTAANGFWEYLPPGYDDGVPRPLLVYWHGIGEDGNGSATDLNKLLVNALPKLIKGDDWPNDRPFVVLSPQHGPSGCPGRDEIHNFLAWAFTAYRIDPKRVYLTGLSCGAIGSWDYLGTYRAQQVAAAVLICGDPGDPAQSWSVWGRTGCSLGDVAIWSLHGDKDSIVTWAWDKATMENLLACPSPPRRDAVWTPIPGADHVIWDPVYDLSGGYGDIYQWMLANPLP